MSRPGEKPTYFRYSSSLLLAACLAITSDGCQAATEPTPFGRLLDFDGITLADIYDKTNDQYMLRPGAPMPGAIKHSGGRIGIIDSGIAHAHPQLAGCVVAEKDFTGEGTEDRIGHGTIVSVEALYSPMDDPNTERQLMEFGIPDLVIAKVAHADGKISRDDVVSAINWCAENKAVVINLSLGFKGDPSQFEKILQTIKAHPDIRFEAAAGNEGPRVQFYPAAFKADNLTSVGESKDDVRVPTSGIGITNSPAGYKFVNKEKYDFYMAKKVQFDKAMAAAAEGHYTQAKPIFQQISDESDNPFFAAAMIQLGLIALAEKDPDTALVQLNRAAKIIIPNSEVFGLIGSAYALKRDNESAEKNFLRSLEINENNFRSRHNLGVIYYRMHLTQKALHQLKELRKRAPNYPDLDSLIQEVENSQK